MARRWQSLSSAGSYAVTRYIRSDITFAGLMAAGSGQSERIAGPIHKPFHSHLRQMCHRVTRRSRIIELDICSSHCPPPTVRQFWHRCSRGRSRESRSPWQAWIGGVLQVGGYVTAASNEGTEKPSRMMYDPWEHGGLDR
jgi:hypothetical protein